MRLYRYLFLTLLAVFACTTTHAKIAVWAFTPQYDGLQRQQGDLFLFRMGSKLGMVKSDGTVVAQAQYDFITDFVEGYALLGIKENGKNRLLAIMSANGNVEAELKTKHYYLRSTRTSFFSEEKLAVKNERDKYGFINPSGQEVIRCQFADALAFRDGWAPVLDGQLMKYIGNRYGQDKSHVLAVDFNYGELSDASCFANGNAVVAYNNKYALIDKYGKVIRKIKESEFDQLYRQNNASVPTADKGFSESSPYHVSQGANGKLYITEGQTVIASALIDKIPTRYDDGYMVVVKGGKYGLLKVTDGTAVLKYTVNGGNSNELTKRKEGIDETIMLSASLPHNARFANIYFDSGDGKYLDMKETLMRRNNGQVRITPIVSKGATSVCIRGYIENDGIFLSEFEETFTINYPIVLRVSQPGPDVIRADSNKVASFSSTIYNDSGKDVDVAYTWSTGKKGAIPIPAGESRTVRASKTVTSNHSETITISVRAGGTSTSASRNIHFQTYF